MVEPRPAATVILLRPNPLRDYPKLEVYLIRRQTHLSFLGGYSAFPGGALEPLDYEPENQGLSRDLDPKEAGSVLGGTLPGREALAYWLAGIRELFEETGILLARAREASLPPPERLSSYQAEIREGTLSITEMMKREKLYYDTSALRYFDHWITPPSSPIRYDARFFLASLPGGQSPNPCPIEFETADWTWPPEALKQFEQGKIKLIPPTIFSLKRLAACANIESLLAPLPKSPRRSPNPVKSVGGF